MSFPLTKRVATFSLAGMCALAMVAPVINAPSAQAAGHRFGISQTFWIRVDGRVTHQFSLIEQSNFISKEACESLPVALEWSRVTFSASPTSTRCTIETDFNRHVNPYVAVDQNQSVTFAARPIALEDLGLELPEDTTLTYQSVSLTGRGFHATQVNAGAETRQDSTGDSVSWRNIGKDVVAAKGTIDADNDFHTQERKTYQGIEAVDMPGDFQDASSTVKANSSSSNSPSPSSTSARSSSGSSGMIHHSLAPSDHRICWCDVYNEVFRPPAPQEQIPERRIPSTRSYTASIPQQVGGSFTGTKPLQRSRKGPLCQHVLNRIAGPLNQHAEKHCAH